MHCTDTTIMIEATIQNVKYNCQNYLTKTAKLINSYYLTFSINTSYLSQTSCRFYYITVIYHVFNLYVIRDQKIV